MNDEPNNLINSIEEISFNNLLIFSNEFNKINALSNKIEKLFLNSAQFVKSKLVENIDAVNKIFDLSQSSQSVEFNHIYDMEIERGNIEYKRNLESYNLNNKSNKLIRQIYWRIYEGIVSTGKECCYYIIGIEDSGMPSFLTNAEIFNSLCFIFNSIDKTELNCLYLFIKNTISNSNYIIVKFFPKNKNLIDYF